MCLPDFRGFLGVLGASAEGGKCLAVCICDWNSNLSAHRLLTPEHSISLQNSIGSDVIMQLDDVIATTSPDLRRMREAMERSVRWLDRCIAAHKYPERQNLFCIIQGGLDLEMRRQCCEMMVERDTPGIAIGGLSGGEAKEDFCKVSVLCP